MINTDIDRELSIEVDVNRSDEKDHVTHSYIETLSLVIRDYYLVKSDFVVVRPGRKLPAYFIKYWR